MEKVSHKKTERVSNIFLSIDQLCNAMAGGHPDVSVSATIGYYNFQNNFVPNAAWFWKKLMIYVDFMWYPKDGDDHCYDAYRDDIGPDYKVPTGWGLYFVCFWVAVIAFFMGLGYYISWGLGRIKPKDKITRHTEITMESVRKIQRIRESISQQFLLQKWTVNHRELIKDAIRENAQKLIEVADDVQK